MVSGTRNISLFTLDEFNHRKRIPDRLTKKKIVLILISARQDTESDTQSTLFDSTLSNEFRSNQLTQQQEQNDNENAPSTGANRDLMISRHSYLEYYMHVRFTTKTLDVVLLGLITPVDKIRLTEQTNPRLSYKEDPPNACLTRFGHQITKRGERHIALHDMTASSSNEFRSNRLTQQQEQNDTENAPSAGESRNLKFTPRTQTFTCASRRRRRKRNLTSRERARRKRKCVVKPQKNPKEWKNRAETEAEKEKKPGDARDRITIEAGDAIANEANNVRGERITWQCDEV